MALYLFSCAEHGQFETRLPMSAVTAHHPCRACGRTAARVFTAPSLNLGDGRARRLIDATKATADQPAVVSSLPGTGRPGPRRALDPRIAKLPRP